MDSLHDARLVLEAAFNPEGAAKLLAVLGFTQPPMRLERTDLDMIGINDRVSNAAVASTEGILRALVFNTVPGTDARQCVADVARRFAAASPHLLWLLVAVDDARQSCTVAAWRCAGRTQHISVLLVQKARIVDSDADTLCALASATTTEGDVMRYMRWLDILGRDSITRRFFQALNSSISTLASSLPESVPRVDAREMALLTTSRLVFLSFLETKGWLDRDFGFLENGFARCMGDRGAYHRNVLEPLFFGTLNTRVRDRAPRAREFGRIPFLNGGLFSRTAVERTHRHQRFPDDAIGSLFGDVIVRFRFSATEDTTEWSQTAVDPEILGRVFEAVMECGDRKRGGVFYTPQHFVERVTSLALRAFLQRRQVAEPVADLIVRGDCPGLEDELVVSTVQSIRLLDPACGSGAFLVHALERLAHIRTILGDTRPRSQIRRDVLTRSIFGVDSNPTAVWLCELRLWLSVVIDSEESDPMNVMPLPNLDRNIRVGDSLAGCAFDRTPSQHRSPGSIAALRARYVRSSGQRKVSLGHQLDGAERERALSAIDREITVARHARRESVAAARARDLFDRRPGIDARASTRLRALRSTVRSLERRRKAIRQGDEPSFAYATHFADVAEAGGFDLVLGNPPWVRIHNIPEYRRGGYRERFHVVRAAAWPAGAREAHVSIGFAGQVDMAALFVERATGLLSSSGTFGLLLPAKLWSSLAGGGVRDFILAHTELDALEDHAEARTAFDAAVYPSIVVASRPHGPPEAASRSVRVGVQRGARFRGWNADAHSISLDSSRGSPWLLLPPECRDAFNALSRKGIALFDSRFGSPRLGVKTGCNEAFLVNAVDSSRVLTSVTRGDRHGALESPFLRTVVRGETLTAWRLTPNPERLIWTHEADGAPLRALPPEVLHWLATSRRSLERRSDLHSRSWWSLFRVESARCDLPRVIWADFGRAPRAAVVEALDPVIPLNTCYSLACASKADALTLAALLNSRVAAAWLGAIAEPARGNFKRFLGWTVSRLPLPADWIRTKQLLEPIALAACNGEPPSSADLDLAVLDAYGLSPDAFAPLLDWMRPADV